MNGITLKPVDKNTDPASVLPVFNTNPSFLEANAEKNEFATADVEMFLYSESRRKNSQLSLITHKDETVIGVVAFVPPQIGTLVLHKSHQPKELAQR